MLTSKKDAQLFRADNLQVRSRHRSLIHHYETDADIYVYYCSKFGTDNLEALLSYKFANVVDLT